MLLVTGKAGISTPARLFLNVLVWKERQGLASSDGGQEMERYLKEGERARNVKHLVTGRDARALELAAIIRDVVGESVGSLPNSHHIDHITIFTHFHAPATGSPCPSTSSRGLVSSAGLTVIDERHEQNHAPTDFGHLLFILLQPFAPEHHNALPFRTICRLAQSLSIGNSREQERVWDKEKGAKGAVLFLERFGTWRRRAEVVALINDLCETPSPSSNLALSIGLRCRQHEEQPRLQDAEEMVRQLVSRYDLAIHKLLCPVDEQERERHTSLVALECNPGVEITITHPLHKPKTIKIIAATDGDPAEVLYDEMPEDSR
ncbi:hypothetical protein QFC20_007870 [Naganishia adeliensis]|uniref:Uncharacterized protein n=1 Tax=Naganishia adeliensis TaxID=92952 RepID=A0ACC2UUK9_9TREE|nr:hypothetical protein QFC20_007870 [Naganishia adeliensis]